MGVLIRNLSLALTFMGLLLGCQETFDKSSLRPDAAGLVPWKDAQRAILSGEVVSVMQSHARGVTFTFDDGSTFQTKEDRLDEVWGLIRDNHLDGKISYATE